MYYDSFLIILDAACSALLSPVYRYCYFVDIGLMEPMSSEIRTLNLNLWISKAYSTKHGSKEPMTFEYTIVHTDVTEKIISIR